MHRALLFPGMLAIVMAALAADDPAPHSVDLGGLRFQAPASWKSITPKSSMRKAQFEVPGKEGAAELVVFVFPGGAGTVDANIDRWRNQFKGANGSAPKAESTTVKGKNVDVMRVQVKGSYTEPFTDKGAQANYRLLGAIVDLPKAGYYFKLVGPDKTVDAAKADFDKLIASISKE